MNGQKRPENKDRSRRISPAFIVFQIALIAAFAVVLAIVVHRVQENNVPASVKDEKQQTAAENDSTDSTAGRGTEDVLLFGIKEGDTSAGGTRDYLLIAHIDYDRKTGKLATIYRDTLMSVPGYGDQRVMNAYALGGPELVLETVNLNLGLQISDYAVVYYDNADTLQELYDAATAHDNAKVAALTDNMLGSMDSSTNTEHERKWVGALGNFDLTSSDTVPAHFWGGEVNGTWVEVPVTLENAATAVHAFLYDDSSYAPDDNVKEISKRFGSIASAANDDLSGAP